MFDFEVAEMSGKKRNRPKVEDEEFEPGSWECTVCTFRNRHEAFKCEMCDTRFAYFCFAERAILEVIQIVT